MSRYRSKPFEIEAVRWLKEGDHPAVIFMGSSGGQSHLTDKHAVEGKQGWVVVEPGDWIITEPDGSGFYPCKPDVFAAKYEAVE